MGATTLLLHAAPARATPPDAESQTQTPTPASSTTSIVLLQSDDHPHQESLVLAIEAQLGALATELEIHGGLPQEADLREDVALAREAGSDAGVIGVFWIRHADEAGASLFLYDVARDRLFVRRLEGSRAAGVADEATAVIMRRSAQGLAEGRPTGMQEIEIPRPEPQPAPEPEPPEAPASPAKQRGKVRIEAAYVGQNYAPQVAWQSGASLRAGWLFRFGLQLDLGYVVVPRVDAENEFAAMRLRRHPIELGVGYRHRLSAFAVGAEVTGILDVVTARTRPLAPELTTPASTRVDLGFGPRAFAVYAPLAWLGVCVGVGVDVFPGTAAYVTDIGGESTLLRPRHARARVQAGLEVRL